MLGGMTVTYTCVRAPRTLFCRACLLFWLAMAAATIAAADETPVPAGQGIAQTLCAGCHGAKGNSTNPAFPKLAGQLASFLELQLDNYKSGERPNPVMVAIAKTLSKTDIAQLSAYYAGQAPMSHEGTADAQTLKRGEFVFKVGKTGAPACRYCHGDNGQGVAPVFARLAGQHPEFIVASLQPYRKESNFKNPYAWVMKAVVQEWSDDDIAAVAAYIGSLKTAR